MGRVRVKICGITSVDDAQMAVEAGADAVGLVFAESPRQVTPLVAAKIVESLPPWVMAVGVFVNTELQETLQIARQARLNAIQFHGEELPCQVEDAARQFKVVKGFRVARRQDLADAQDYLGQCRPHACLVDSRVEGRHGGTGQQPPWELLVGLREGFWPLILSGGLTPENVAEVIRHVQPFGVDVSSGVESAPGKKSRQKVRAFVLAALSVNVTYPSTGELRT